MATTHHSPLTTHHSPDLFFGYDVARVRDLAVLAVVERVGDVFWTRALIEMPGAKFSAQEQVLRDVIPFCVRGAVDSTGLGMEMAERLAGQFPGKVEPVSFTLARKQDLAVRMKRSFEEKTIRIPDHRELRRDLNAVKRIVTTAGNVRFDAERTDQGHADRFWALALALHAADRRWAPFASGELDSEPEWYESEPRPSGRGHSSEPPFETAYLSGFGSREWAKRHIRNDTNVLFRVSVRGEKLLTTHYSPLTTHRGNLWA